MNLSNCCNKYMQSICYDRIPDEGSTYFYICSECKKTCDPFIETKEEKIKNHMKNIHEMALEFTAILNNYYPEVVSKTFNEYGFPYLEGVPATERIRTCLYVELIKAGVFNDTL